MDGRGALHNMDGGELCTTWMGGEYCITWIEREHCTTWMGGEHYTTWMGGSTIQHGWNGVDVSRWQVQLDAVKMYFSDMLNCWYVRDAMSHTY